MTKFHYEKAMEVFASSAVIYSSAVARIFQYPTNFHYKLLFRWNDDDYIETSDLKIALINEFIHIVGPYKLVDSIFEFDSVNEKAVISAIAAGLVDIVFYSAIKGSIDYLDLLIFRNEEDFFNKYMLVSLLSRIVGTAIFTYINYDYTSEDSANCLDNEQSAELNALA